VTDILKLAQDLVVLREQKDFITHPLVVPLVNAAFAEELRQCRKIAEEAGCAREFELVYAAPLIMH
jgi:hypothetical protein